MWIVALGFVTCAAAVQGPVGNVVTLLEELKAKVESDKEKEQKVFNKFACWCEETTGRKVAAIEHGKSELQRLSNSVLINKGKQVQLATQIASLKKQIAENLQTQRQATAIRGTENADFMTERGETEEALGAVYKAVRVLEGAGEGSPKPEDATTKLLSMATSLRSALGHPQAALSAAQIRSVRSFITNPLALYQEAYSPQSATVQGILKDMYASFAGNLQSSTVSEATKQHNFEAFIAAKQKELDELRTTLTEKTRQNAEAGLALQSAKTDYELTTAQLEEDEAFFKEATGSCKKKSADWATRSQSRAEELVGIEKAIEILDSEEAKTTFSKSTVLLQLDSVRSARERAAGALRRAARRSGRHELLQLATKLRSRGHFDNVVRQVDELLKELQREEQTDIESRDACIEETHRNDMEKARLDDETRVLDARIKKQENDILTLEEKVTAVSGEITDTEKAVEDATTDRDAAREAFKTTVADNKKAIALLDKATVALSAFFKNKSFLQREPEFEKSPDVAPDASDLKADYAGQTQRSKGIIAILEEIKSEIAIDNKNAIAEDKDAQVAFEKLVGAARQSIHALKERKDNLTLDKGEVEAKKTKNEGSHETKSEELKGVEAAIEKMKPACDSVMALFQERKELRQAERDGLVEAKALLSGAEQAMAEQFLQGKDESESTGSDEDTVDEADEADETTSDDDSDAFLQRKI